MSSKRRIRGRACTGKVRHASVGDGQAAMNALQLRKGYDGPMNCYRCPFCKGWHIGHRPRKR